MPTPNSQTETIAQVVTNLLLSGLIAVAVVAGAAFLMKFYLIPIQTPPVITAIPPAVEQTNHILVSR